MKSCLASRDPEPNSVPVALAPVTQDESRKTVTHVISLFTEVFLHLVPYTRYAQHEALHYGTIYSGWLASEALYSLYEVINLVGEAYFETETPVVKRMMQPIFI